MTISWGLDHRQTVLLASFALRRALILIGWVGRVDEFVQMNDKIAHMRIIDMRLRGGSPRIVCLHVIRKKPDHIHLIKVFEFYAVNVAQLSAEHHMKKLLCHKIILTV